MAVTPRKESQAVWLQSPPLLIMIPLYITRTFIKYFFGVLWSISHAGNYSKEIHTNVDGGREGGGRGGRSASGPLPLPCAPPPVTSVHTPVGETLLLSPWESDEVPGTQLQMQEKLALSVGRGYGEQKDHFCLPGDPRRYSCKQPGFWSALGKKEIGEVRSHS